jgi:hypothetical protein
MASSLDRMKIAMDAARDEVAARDRARGAVATAISVKRSKGSAQIELDAAFESGAVVRLNAVIEENRNAAAASVGAQAKATRKYVEGREFMSGKAMVLEDSISKYREALDRADARAVAAETASSSAAAASASLAQAASAAPLPEAKFQTGQSVLQWWAGWFTACPEGETPKQINKKLRPGWFSAEILSALGLMDIVYAGVRKKGHCYMVA